jgi:hypothetical protein
MNQKFIGQDGCRTITLMDHTLFEVADPLKKDLVGFAN